MAFSIEQAERDSWEVEAWNDHFWERATLMGRNPSTYVVSFHSAPSPDSLPCVTAVEPGEIRNLQPRTVKEDRDKYVQRVIERHQKRAEEGRSKYGVTMERGDLSFSDWLLHLQEELMDAAVYLERLKDENHPLEPECEHDFGLHETPVSRCHICGQRKDPE